MINILVIDDDEQIQSYLLHVLGKEGYGVRLAHNGVEGLRSYRQEAADIVFCDIFMESMEGLETIRHFLQEFPQAQIIAMSGGSMLFEGDYLYHARKFGAVATLSKPLKRVLLLESVQKVLNDRGNG